MNDGERLGGAKGQRGSDGPATCERSCWPTHTLNDFHRPPCEFVHRIMLKSTQGEIHARRRRDHLNVVVKNLGTFEKPGK